METLMLTKCGGAILSKEALDHVTAKRELLL